MTEATIEDNCVSNVHFIPKSAWPWSVVIMSLAYATYDTLGWRLEPIFAVLVLFFVICLVIDGFGTAMDKAVIASICAGIVAVTLRFERMFFADAHIVPITPQGVGFIFIAFLVFSYILCKKKMDILLCFQVGIVVVLAFALHSA